MVAVRKDSAVVAACKGSTGSSGRLTRRMIGYKPFIWFVCIFDLGTIQRSRWQS